MIFFYWSILPATRVSLVVLICMCLWNVLNVIKTAPGAGYKLRLTVHQQIMIIDSTVRTCR